MCCLCERVCPRSGRSSQDATKLRPPTTQSNPVSRLARMHVKMSSNTEAVGCSDILSFFFSSGLSNVMRHAVGAILQHSSSAHGKSLRGPACSSPSISLVEPTSSNITSPSPRLDQPHTSDCVELPWLECGVRPIGITMLGLVKHPSAACPSMYEAGLCITSGRCHQHVYTCASR